MKMRYTTTLIQESIPKLISKLLYFLWKRQHDFSILRFLMMVKIRKRL